MPRQKKESVKANGGANLGFGATLWAAADKLRSNVDAAVYKHVVRLAGQKQQCPKS